jgi:hypothetical protein
VIERACGWCGALTTYDPKTGEGRIGRCPHIARFSMVEGSGESSVRVHYLPDPGLALRLLETGGRSQEAISHLSLTLLAVEADEVRGELGQSDEDAVRLRVAREDTEELGFQINELESELAEMQARLEKLKDQRHRMSEN